MTSEPAELQRLRDVADTPKHTRVIHAVVCEHHA